MLMDENGNVVFHKTSQKTNEVIFNKQETSSMCNGILTHNHSNGTTFTANDIYMLRKGNLNEMRASTQEGAYVIRPPFSWNENFNSIKQLMIYCTSMK